MIRSSDVLRVGGRGVAARPLRAVLSALGIAIGIAAMVAVVGISASAQADLDRALARLGTNLLTVAPGQSLTGQPATLPDSALSMIGRIAPVESVSEIGSVNGADVYRTDKIPTIESGGLGTYAVRTDLLGTVGGTVRDGTWLNAATARYPAAVLGATAADRLGVERAEPGLRIDVGGTWFTVVGILDPVPLAPELDSGALIGWPVAQARFGFNGHASTIYTRVREDQVEAVDAVLGRTANPQHPEEVLISRPSDLLVAKRIADRGFTALLLGLGAVALLVGGVGVANTMVISVLERRTEIGLRRALGATRGDVRMQFLTESLLLSGLGGLGGVGLGALATSGYCVYQRYPTVLPVWVAVGGITATLVIGALAGIYPAVRASRLPPTEALAV